MQIDGGKLKLLMKEQGMNAEDLSVRSGVSAQTLKRIGKVGRCHTATIRKLAWALDVETEELFASSREK